MGDVLEVVGTDTLVYPRVFSYSEVVVRSV
jgi:hypothetical protein